MHLSKLTLMGLLCLALVLAAVADDTNSTDSGIDKSQRTVGISLGKWKLGNIGLGNIISSASSSSLPAGVSVGTGISTDTSSTGTVSIGTGIAADSTSSGSTSISVGTSTDALTGGLTTGSAAFGWGALTGLVGYLKALTKTRLVTKGIGIALLATGVGLIIAFGVLASELKRRSSDDTYATYEDSYNAQYRSTSDNVDWSNLNILDYISMMEEMWRKFDVKDVECQKRVLCELHQNRDSLGQPAEKVVNAFGYLRYLSFMKLPSDMNSLLDDYQEAADKGRTFNKDCGEIYNACNFSFKDTYLKYVGNKSNNSL